MRTVDTTVPTVSENEECEDRNWRCIFWSLPVFQYCEKSEAVRTGICPASCGTCLRQKGTQPEGEKGGGECEDKSSLCTQLGREHCLGLMGRLFCQRTCELCS